MVNYNNKNKAIAYMVFFVFCAVCLKAHAMVWLGEGDTFLEVAKSLVWGAQESSPSLEEQIIINANLARDGMDERSNMPPSAHYRQPQLENGDGGDNEFNNRRSSLEQVPSRDYADSIIEGLQDRLDRLNEPIDEDVVGKLALLAGISESSGVESELVHEGLTEDMVQSYLSNSTLFYAVGGALLCGAVYVAYRARKAFFVQ